MQSLIVLLASVISLPAMAEVVTVGSFPKEECIEAENDSFGNTLIYSTDGKGDSCIFIYSETDAKLATMIINKKPVKLHEKSRSYESPKKKKSVTQPELGQKSRQILVSEDKKITVTIVAEIIRSTCNINSEGCCGNDYAGEVVVNTENGSAKKNVHFYRGG